MRLIGMFMGFSLVASAAGMAAQQPGAGVETVTTFPPVSIQIRSACPVGFRAEIDPRLRMLQVAKGKAAADSTLLHLIFDTADSGKKIVSADVTVHGAAPKSELMLVGVKLDEDRTQDFTVSRPEGMASTTVQVTKMPLVRWVALNQLTYADGSVWHVGDWTVCKSVLTGFHPVSQRH